MSAEVDSGGDSTLKTKAVALAPLLSTLWNMRVGFYATLRKIVGAKYVELSIPEDPTLQQVIDTVLLVYPKLSDELLDESGEFSSRIHLMVDGRSSKWLPGGLDTVVASDQMIEFFPAVAGG